MGLPALRGEPPLTAASASGVDPLRGQFDAVLPSDNQFDLQAIVEAVFDPGEDLVLYELRDAAFQWNGDRRRLLFPQGTALAAAVACAEGRARLGREHFIVVVVAPAQWRGALQEESPGLSSIRCRLVILAPADSDCRGTISELEAAGWRIEDLTGRSTARGVAKALVAARYDERATIVLIDPALSETFGSQLSRQVAERNAAPAALPRDAQAALASELQRRIAADPRLTPLVLVDDPVWRPLRGPSLPGTEPPAALRIQRGLWQAVALHHAGCHPVVVIDEADLAGQGALLAGVLPGTGSRGTFIVLTGGRPGAPAPEWPHELEHRRLPPGMSDEDAARVLADCRAAAVTIVLHVPRRRVAAAEQLASIAGTDESVDARSDETVFAHPALAAHSRALSSAAAAFSADDVWNAARRIRDYRFNPQQQKWIDRYCAVGKRNIYLWRWTACAVEWLTLSCVAPEWRTSVCDTKFLAAMLNVLLDDVVDEQHDPSALNEILSLMTEDPAPSACRLGRYGEFIVEVWSEITRRVRQYPREPEFRLLLSYDFRQLCNQVDYSGLLHRHPHLINQTEHDLYSPHGMMVACTATIDLTCSPGFRTADLGTLREAVWHANSMARIGNLVTTWQREIGHDDFSSGVFARAVSLGWLQADQLSSANRLAIEAAITRSGIEQEFALRWEQHREQMRKLAARASSVSILALIDGLERLFASEYASRGQK